MELENRVSEQINDIKKENLEKLAQLFPSIIKDGQVDFKALKEELGEFEEVKEERYEFTWAGKQNAKKKVQEDVGARTLKYIEEDSKNPDTTENLYIEGDNLEVLKLLRQNYYGSIKMIYIDPPYNTGNDFIYNDNFKMSTKESSVSQGYINEANERLEKNTKDSNKFHAKWLNEMYPRLRIAKDLLTDDGLIFISIDNNEQAQLKLLCDEIFEPENFVTVIHVELSTTMGMKVGSAKKGNIVKNGEYILVYSKNGRKDICKELIYDSREFDEHFSIYYDNTTQEYTTLKNKIFENEVLKDEIEKYENKKITTLFSNSKKIKEFILNNSDKIYQNGNFDVKLSNEELNTIETEVPKIITREGKEYIIVKNKKGTIRQLMSLKSLVGKADDYYSTFGLRKIRGDFWKEYYLDMVNINKEGNINFENGKKPVRLIKHLIKLLGKNENIILDFFSGSATTAHAVMQLNAEDGGNRKYIMVQLNELTYDGKKEKYLDENGEERERYIIDEETGYPIVAKDSEARKEGFYTICEIGKERIRRAGELIKKEIEESNKQLQLGEESKKVPDIGFKVFRTADTNINWKKIREVSKDNVMKFDDPDMLDFTLGFNDKDVVYEVLLRQRDLPLSEKLVILTDIGSRTYLYADSYLVCLETNVTEELIEKLAELNPLPIKFIFRDSAFGSKIGLKEETFRRLKTLVERNSGLTKKAYTVEFI